MHKAEIGRTINLIFNLDRQDFVAKRFHPRRRIYSAKGELNRKNDKPKPVVFRLTLKKADISQIKNTVFIVALRDQTIVSDYSPDGISHYGDSYKRI